MSNKLFKIFSIIFILMLVFAAYLLFISTPQSFKTDPVMGGFGEAVILGTIVLPVLVISYLTSIIIIIWRSAKKLDLTKYQIIFLIVSALILVPFILITTKSFGINIQGLFFR